MTVGGENFYSSDQPITSHENDRFDRWPFAHRIAKTIARRHESSSLVIGIYGPWGDGKTSVLHLMKEAFEGDQSVVVMSFNPWLFESESHLIVSFFHSLSDALGRRLAKKGREIGRILEQYSSLLSVGSIGPLKPDEAARQIGKKLSTIELDDLKKKFQNILEKSRKRVVVMIDDIDRLEPREIQAIFKLIKLSADFENISYVLAFDDNIVSRALGEKYGPGNAESGREFLEKIIQVPLHLPPVARLALVKLTFEAIESALREHKIELTKDAEEEFARAFLRGLEIRLKTPRQVKRYSNALAFSLPLLQGEVNPIDQMLIEGMRVLYPSLYMLVRDNPDVCLGSSGVRRRENEWKKRHLEILEAGVREFSPVEQEAAKELLQTLFPQLKSVFGNTIYGSDSEARWVQERRICSDRYFHRYFHYAVPSGDIADAAIDGLLAAADVSPEALVEKLREHCVDGAARKLIEKVYLRLETIDPICAANLARCIAQNGDLFPMEPGIFGGWITSTFGRASSLVKSLATLTHDVAERERLIIELIQTAEPLLFAARLFFWLRSEKDEPNAVVSPECQERLAKIVAGRIAGAAAKWPLYDLWPQDAYYLFELWFEFGQSEEANQYLEKRISQNPGEAISLISCYAGKALSLTTGRWHQGDLTRQGYNNLARLVSPELIMKQLKAIHGSALDSPEYHASKSRSIEEQLAHQFAFLYLKSQEAPPAAPE